MQLIKDDGIDALRRSLDAYFDAHPEIRHLSIRCFGNDDEPLNELYFSRPKQQPKAATRSP